MSTDTKPLQRFVLVTSLPGPGFPDPGPTIELIQRFAFPSFAMTSEPGNFWTDEVRARLGRIQPIRGSLLDVRNEVVRWTDAMTPFDTANIWLMLLNSHWAQRTEKQMMSFLMWLNSQPVGVKYAYTCKPYSKVPRMLVSLTGTEPKAVDDPLLERASGLYEITDFATAYRLGSITDSHILPPLTESAFYAMP